MKMTVKLPRIDDSGVAVVLDWLAEAGQGIAAGDGLLTVETGKAVVEVPSPVAGVLLSKLVQIDDEVETGQAIAIVDGNS